MITKIKLYTNYGKVIPITYKNGEWVVLKPITNTEQVQVNKVIKGLKERVW